MVTHLPGVKRAAKNATNPQQYWELSFDEQIIDLVVDCIDRYFQSILGKCSRERNAQQINK